MRAWDVTNAHGKRSIHVNRRRLLSLASPLVTYVLLRVNIERRQHRYESASSQQPAIELVSDLLRMDAELFIYFSIEQLHIRGASSPIERAAISYCTFTFCAHMCAPRVHDHREFMRKTFFENYLCWKPNARVKIRKTCFAFIRFDDLFRFPFLR